MEKDLSNKEEMESIVAQNRESTSGLMNPQREYFVYMYNTPTSGTFGNAYQSAIQAGFSHNYAIKIGYENPKWFQDHCRHGALMEKAEKVLNKYLDMDVDEPGIMRIQQDTAKFVASSLGKEAYSSRRELTGKDGKKLFTKKSSVKVERVMDDFLGSGESAKVTYEQEVQE